MPFSITFTGNHAEQSGRSHLYMPINNCKDGTATSYLTITPLQEDLNDSQVLSFPANVQLCGCSDPNIYSIKRWYEGRVATYLAANVQLCGCSDSNICSIKRWYEGRVATYPGRAVSLKVALIDYGSSIYQQKNSLHR